VVVRGVPDRGVTLAQIGKKGNLYMSKCRRSSGESSGVLPAGPRLLRRAGANRVDPDTGEVTIHAFVVVQDVGKAINPLGVEARCRRRVQSIACADEASRSTTRRLTNPSLLDYKKLTAATFPTSRRSSSRSQRGRPLRRPRVASPDRAAPARWPTRSTTRRAFAHRATLTPERIALAMARQA